MASSLLGLKPVRQQQVGTVFPLARLVGVMSLSHGAVLEVATGTYQGKGTGEHGLFRRLQDCFVAGDAMLADSYFCSHFLIAERQQHEVNVLFEQHGARIADFRRGQPLGARDHRVSWQKPPPKWMSDEDYRGIGMRSRRAR